MSDLRAAVSSIYEAFGSGDIPALLEYLAEDVRWEQWESWSPHTAGVPWLLPRSGRQGALEFFQIVGAWTILSFRVLDLMASETQVTAEVEIEVRLPNGAAYRDQEMHLWTFDTHGKVAGFRHYVDTAKHIAAAQIG